jgi:hypothetical protein
VTIRGKIKILQGEPATPHPQKIPAAEEPILGDDLQNKSRTLGGMDRGLR